MTTRGPIGDIEPPAPTPDTSLPNCIVDSRRLLGANLYSLRPGAVLELLASDDERPALLLAWRTTARHFAARLGWTGVETIVRTHPGGAQCFISAPIDALLTATEVNEQAWLAAERLVEGRCVTDERDVIDRLRVHAHHESRPRLVALEREAARRGVNFTVDDDSISLGAGTGSVTVPLGALPIPGMVQWEGVHDIPIALVTGSNGKTTTTRLLAAMLSEGGHVAALTSTDGVWCAGQLIDEGDYSGPAGARLALRDQRATAAVLETARGGILRRGLAVTHAAAAVVTRVTADHLGEYGIHDLRALGEVKLVVARVVTSGGRVVLNADDRTLVALAATVGAPITWFSLDAGNPTVAAHVAAGGEACVLRDDTLTYVSPAGETALGEATTMPLTLGGAARYNVANALAASATAIAMGVAPDAVRATLARFGRLPTDNPGRLSLLEYNGARIVVDFVHNPDGWLALSDALHDIPARRRLVVIGQAGDRDDEALEELAAAVWNEEPDVVILKEMPRFLRGRESGDVTGRLAEALLSLDCPREALRFADGELAAVQLAMAESRPGDLLILSVHADYHAAMHALQEAGARVVSSFT